MWITFSLFLQYSYVLASVQCENCSYNDYSFPAIPNMPGSIGPKWFGLQPPNNLGSGHATISDAWISTCFTIYKLSLVFFAFFSISVALAKNTTGITTATTMASAGGNGLLAPHMRPCTCANASNGWVTTLKTCGCIFGGNWWCVWPSKRSFVPAMMHCHNIGVFWGPYTTSTAPKIISACLGSC